MIEHRWGDIFEQPDLTHIAHQANLFHTFGSGIAAEIKKRYPQAYERDCSTEYGSKQKLGSYSWSWHVPDPVIINLYCQNGINAQVRQTNYAAMGSCFLKLERELELGLAFQGSKKDLLGIPYGIGCGLGGGDWKIVREIIGSAFEKSHVKVVICRKMS